MSTTATNENILATMRKMSTTDMHTAATIVADTATEWHTILDDLGLRNAPVESSPDLMRVVLNEGRTDEGLIEMRILIRTPQYATTYEEYLSTSLGQRNAPIKAGRGGMQV